MSIKEELIPKIQNKTLTMGVCGLGYVGLPLAVDKAKHGFRTIGFDIQQEKVDMVNAGKNYIGDVVDADLQELVSTGMLKATTDFSEVCKVDFVASVCLHLWTSTSSRISATSGIPPLPSPNTSSPVPWWYWSPPPIPAPRRS